MSKAITARALYQEVAERLRQRIFSNAIAPGAWIDELRLAQEYGISRTPLREALKVLATEGLVTMRPRRGAYVTEVNTKDATEIFHLLALLEADACASVVNNLKPAQLEKLEALHTQLQAAAQGDKERFFALNEQFHYRLLELNGNKWLLQMVQDLRKVMKLHRHNSLDKSGRIHESLQEHETLMQALRTGDAAAAKEAMQQHIQRGYQAAIAVS